MSDTDKTKRNLENARDVHWRTDDDGFEYIMRTLATAKPSVTLTAAEREKWFTPGWKQRLEAMRKKHRAAGLSDEQFWHPAKRKEMSKAAA